MSKSKNKTEPKSEKLFGQYNGYMKRTHRDNILKNRKRKSAYYQLVIDLGNYLNVNPSGIFAEVKQLKVGANSSSISEEAATKLSNLTNKNKNLQTENTDLKQQVKDLKQKLAQKPTQPTSNVANNADSATNQDSSSNSVMYHDKDGNPETLAQHKHNEEVNRLFGGDDSESSNSSSASSSSNTATDNIENMLQQQQQNESGSSITDFKKLAEQDEEKSNENSNNNNV